MAEFLDLLEANPYLEELLLDDAGPSINTSHNRPYATYVLCYNLNREGVGTASTTGYGPISCRRAFAISLPGRYSSSTDVFIRREDVTQR